MKTIRKRRLINACLVGLSILICMLLLVFGEAWSDIHGRIFLSSIMIIGLIPNALLVYESVKYRVAKLITENPIMHFNTAIIRDISVQGPGQPYTKHDEIIVSYFGILVNNRTIVFNQNGIQLKAVVIGGDFISLTYGTPIWTRNIRLLCPLIGPVAMDEISEKFRYETGIIPSFISIGIDDR